MQLITWSAESGNHKNTSNLNPSRIVCRINAFHRGGGSNLLCGVKHLTSRWKMLCFSTWARSPHGPDGPAEILQRDFLETTLSHWWLYKRFYTWMAKKLFTINYLSASTESQNQILFQGFLSNYSSMSTRSYFSGMPLSCFPILLSSYVAIDAAADWTPLPVPLISYTLKLSSNSGGIVCFCFLLRSQTFIVKYQYEVFINRRLNGEIKWAVERAEWIKQCTKTVFFCDVNEATATVSWFRLYIIILDSSLCCDIEHQHFLHYRHRQPMLFSITEWNQCE